MYIAKTIFQKHPPFPDLINEVLGKYGLDFFGVQSIPACILKIPQEVFNDFKEEGKEYDARYDKLDLNEAFFFGSLMRDSTIELERFNFNLKNKFDYKKYNEPLRFIKIGIFDYWLANMDRRFKNPNILINQNESGLFEFLPIDHTQLFANQNSYKNLKPAVMNTPPPGTILDSSISKSILKFTDQEILANFHNEIQAGFGSVLDNIDFIFNQVPSDFGLSKKGKIKIKDILSDKVRNNRISKVYHTFAK